MSLRQLRRIVTEAADDNILIPSSDLKVAFEQGRSYRKKIGDIILASGWDEGELWISVPAQGNKPRPRYSLRINEKQASLSKYVFSSVYQTEVQRGKTQYFEIGDAENPIGSLYRNKNFIKALKAIQASIDSVSAKNGELKKEEDRLAKNQADQAINYRLTAAQPESASENTKVTLTIKQLRRLVRESDVLDAFNKFAAAAKETKPHYWYNALGKGEALFTSKHPEFSEVQVEPDAGIGIKQGHVYFSFWDRSGKEIECDYSLDMDEAEKEIMAVPEEERAEIVCGWLEDAIPKASVG